MQNMSYKKRNSFICLSIFLFACLEYLPIPFIPSKVSSFIQLISGYVQLTALLLITILIWYSIKRYVVVLAVLLSLTIIFPAVPRTIANSFVIMSQSSLNPEDNFNPICGTIFEKNNKKASYEWKLSFDGYEILVHQNNHGLITDLSEVETIKVINKDWYLIKKSGWE
jgi:hypothetical protein